jgi:diguanylate cyclase (GGDEF)-like protein
VKILIAEDDDTSRLILQRSLERLGHQCLASRNGEVAWELLQEQGAEVVISDWMMPGQNGLRLCQKIRQESGPNYVYVMLVTTLGDMQHFRAGMQAGADDYLVKPVDRDELELRLLAAERVVSLHRQLAEKNDELERLNQAVAKIARTDPLTQLGNRLGLREDFKELQASGDRSDHRYCAAMIDIDYFKEYNDHYGHLAGDVALQAVAETITQQCRESDRAYRYGGEEFFLLLAEQSIDLAAIAVERIRKAVIRLSIPHVGNPQGVVTISAGLAALRSTDRKSCEVLLREADEALYRAKQTGRNQITVCESAPEVKAS